MATAALIIGIIALLFGIGGFFVITIPLAIILGIVALVLGILGMRRAPQLGGTGRGAGIAGLVTGVLGALGGVLWIVLFVVGFQMIDDPAFEEFIEEMEEFEEMDDFD